MLYNTHVIETTLSILSGASNKSVTTKKKYNNETIHSSHSGATFYIPLTDKYKEKNLSAQAVFQIYHNSLIFYGLYLGFFL